MEKKLLKKNDFVLIGALFFIFLLIFLLINLLGKEGMMVTVSVDGNQTVSFPLSKDTEYTISGYNGGTNTLVIDNGAAYLKDTSCPDHLCEKMGKISKVGESVICLPNRVVVEITGDDSKKEYDAIVGG